MATAKCRPEYMSTLTGTIPQLDHKTGRIDVLLRKLKAGHRLYDLSPSYMLCAPTLQPPWAFSQGNIPCFMTRPQGFSHANAANCVHGSGVYMHRMCSWSRNSLQWFCTGSAVVPTETVLVGDNLAIFSTLGRMCPLQIEKSPLQHCTMCQFATPQACPCPLLIHHPQSA